MKTNAAEKSDGLSTLEDLRTTGARARAKRIARHGLPEFAENARINKYRQAAAQYRACVALVLSREEILQETGWSLQWLMTIENYVEKEDKELYERKDPRLVFAEYRQRQLQCARELEDLTEIYRRSKQYSAMVNAVKARSDIIDRIFKTGQDLGIIEKKAKKIEIDGKVGLDVTSLSVEELRVHVSTEVRELADLLNLPPAPDSTPAGAVLRRLTGAPPIERRVRTKRIRRVVEAEVEPG